MNKFRIFLFFTIVLLNVSCLEITNKLVIRSDRSGTFAVWIDVGALQFIQGQNFFGDIVNNVTDFAEKAKSFLQDKEGISQIVDLTDPKKGIYGIQFDFNKPSTLNALAYKMTGIEKMFFYPNIYKIKKRTITITNITPLLQQTMKQDNQFSSQSYFADQVRNYIFFTTIIETPKKIKKASNQRTIIDGNVAKLRMSLYDIEQGAYYGNKIKF